ncbi:MULTISPECIES: hypothetical protein [Nocardia]|uniref:hypothetical protein n=1 Tax=Nocardia TaxID=1817 RepID=UPI001300AD77|nr:MULTISPECIES: hypothetical protein [Nocardia]
MTFTLGDVLANLVAASVGIILANAAGWFTRQRNERKLGKSFREFFGSAGPYMIVHSAIFDAPEQAYNYPATDTHAARALATLFESLGLKEGAEFSIHPDRRVSSNDDLWNNNLVLVCGPARNSVLRQISERIEMRYSITAENDDNILVDSFRNPGRLRSSREAPPGEVNGNFDYGLIASISSPRNPARKLVILAGIHGTGTLGAAQFVSDGDNLSKLNQRRSQGSVSEVIRVRYDDIEQPKPGDLL